MNDEPFPIDRLIGRATELDDLPGRQLVPEHVAKEVLARFGVAVPRGIATDGVAADDIDELAGDAGVLADPLVLKAFGPDVVHKSDLGAVEVGVAGVDLADRVRAMGDTLSASGVRTDGFLVEEQVSGGVELIVGAVRREPFGVVVVVGLGGTLTEAIDRTATALHPLSRSEAARLVDALPELVLGGGRRGGPLDRAALADLLVRVCGPDGLVSALGDWFEELELNPLSATGARFVALDARLVLRADPASTPRPLPRTDFTSLFAPRQVAVAGASTSRTTFGNRFLAAYRDAGWRDGLYALHPEASEVDGVPAVASASEIPGGVDYLVAAVPAARSPELVASASAASRFIHVISGGFSEVDDEGEKLERQLVEAGEAGGARLVGPNCMGVHSPAGRQTFLLNAPRQPGRTSVVSQSGSLAGEIVFGTAARGVALAKLVTIGNAVDVGSGELLDWLMDDPDTDAVGLYVEAVTDDRLVPALRRACGTKPVVVLAGGLSSQGARAVASHTGSLAGDRATWSAVSESLGVTVVDRLEHLLAALSYLQANEVAASGGPRASSLLVGPGGGASVLATDAFDRHGLTLAPVAADIRAGLVDRGYGVGTSVANPVEIPIGPGTDRDAFQRLLEPLLAAQRFDDVVLHINVQSWQGFSTAGVESLLELVSAVAAMDLGPARLGLVLRSLSTAQADDAQAIRAACVAGGLAAFGDFDEAAVGVAAAQRFARARATRTNDRN